MTAESVPASRPRLNAGERARIRRLRASATGEHEEKGSRRELAVVPVASTPVLTEQEREAIAHRRAHAQAANTRSTYTSAWSRFENWCADRGFEALPAHPDTVAAYLAVADDERDDHGEPRYARTTLELWVAAISRAHRDRQLPDPTRSPIVGAVVEGIKRLRTSSGERPDKAVPLLHTDLEAIVSAIADHSAGRAWRPKVYARRDIALLVWSYAGAFRESELCGLWIADIDRAGDPDDKWLAILLRGTKTTQTHSPTVVLPRGTGSALLCPWCVYLRWLAVVAAYDTAATGLDPAAGQAAGAKAVQRLLRRPDDPTSHICDAPWPRVPRTRAPLYRPIDHGLPRDRKELSGYSFGEMIKKRALQAGYPADAARAFRGHSPRAGFSTDGLARGISAYDIGRHTRQTVRTVAGYDRNQPWTNNPAAGLL